MFLSSIFTSIAMFVDNVDSYVNGTTNAADSAVSAAEQSAQTTPTIWTTLLSFTPLFIFLLIMLIGGFLLALIPANIAKNKGHRFGLWYVYGLFLFLIALIHAACLPDDRKTNVITKPQTESVVMFCPKCGNRFPEGKKYCDQCGTALSKVLPEGQ